MSKLKKIIKNASFFELGITVLTILFIYLPVFKFGSKNKNAFIAIFGFSQGNYSVIDFSFFALLPYLLLFVILVLVIIFDSKMNKTAEIIKALLFIVCGFLFVFYLYLVNPSSILSFKEIKLLLTPSFGHIVSAVLCFIGSLFCIAEIYFINTNL